MPDPALPQTYPRRLLLAVTGLSPQVVTETLYALVKNPMEPWVPTEIHLITTSEGARRAQLSLLSEEPGWFHRLCRDYHLPPVAFDADHIHVLQNSRGQPLDDIRTPENNRLSADFITEKVRHLTSDPTASLHVSIAGGRKTMGYYLGYALSLFGRPQDRLSHVLVSEPFESSWNFFYPTPYSQIIETRDKALADTRDAEVTLAEIPFVSLRDGLPDRLLKGAASFSDTIDAARKSRLPPHIDIDLPRRCLHVQGEQIKLSPAEFAFYTLFARSRKEGLPPMNSRSEALVPRYLNEYALVVGRHSGQYVRAEKALDCEDCKDWFDQRLSRTNKAIVRALGERLAASYLITPGGQRPYTYYGLTLAPEAITFIGEKLAGGEKLFESSQNNCI